MGPQWENRVEDAVEQIALRMLENARWKPAALSASYSYRGRHYSRFQRNSKKSQEHSTKLKNRIEVDTLLDTYDTPKLNQKEAGYLNSSISSNAIEAVII